MTTMLSFDRNSVCDWLELPYSVADDVLFDTIQKEFERLDEEKDTLQSELSDTEDKRKDKEWENQELSKKLRQLLEQCEALEEKIKILQSDIKLRKDDRIAMKCPLCQEKIKTDNEDYHYDFVQHLLNEHQDFSEKLVAVLLQIEKDGHQLDIFAHILERKYQEMLHTRWLNS